MLVDNVRNQCACVLYFQKNLCSANNQKTRQVEMLFAHATAKAPGTFLYLSGASSCVGGFLAGPSGYVCGSAFFCVLVRELSPAGVLKKNFFGKILKYFRNLTIFFQNNSLIVQMPRSM